MQLGDKVTIAGYEWTTRPFSAAEHQLWSELVRRYGLEEKTAKSGLSVLDTPSRRGKLLEADILALEKKLEAQGTDSDEGRLKAYELASEIDLLQEKYDELEHERGAKRFSEQERLLEDTYTAYAELMYVALHADGYAEPYEAFELALSEEDYQTIQQACDAGKVKAPLSHLIARLGANPLIAAAISTNSDSSATPPSETEPAKPGKGGRSRKSSGTSKPKG